MSCRLVTQGIQGEFGIGLLSFWTVGDQLTISSRAADGRTYEMVLKKDDPGYLIRPKHLLFQSKATEIAIQPLLPGLRQINGEKIQNYLASELRDRIKKTGVKIRITDRSLRKEFKVEPREFEGRLLHNLPLAEGKELYLEIYLSAQNPENRIGLYRSGTRVLPSLSVLEQFNSPPWTSGYLAGIIDAPFLKLTPGTRDNIIRDECFHEFCNLLAPVGEELSKIIEEQKKAEEEKTSKEILKSIHKAFREAFFTLPREEYDWFDLYVSRKKTAETAKPAAGDSTDTDTSPLEEINEAEQTGQPQEKEFFEFSGPLFSVIISPASSIVSVGKEKTFRAVARDKRRKQLEKDVIYEWKIKEGAGEIQNPSAEIVTYKAPTEPGLTVISVTVRQENIEVTADCRVTVTDSLIEKAADTQSGNKKGFPGYTFQKAPGRLWRSRYNEADNLIVINNGHSDFVYASKNNSRKLRYICRLYAKDLVQINFKGLPTEQLLERMVELSLYTEENL